MTKSELFQQTIDAWLTKDINKLLSGLSADIIYTECYGAQYQGKAEIEKWFRQWNNPVENQVKSWSVDKSYVDNERVFSHGFSIMSIKGKKIFLMEFLLLNFLEIKFVKFKNLNKNMKNFVHF
ncbi:nuclear transport factor 2 family protein [Lactococcus cremoris]|uniref:Nuclear transport factor 2 family protein n=1 Tax=Lactococcus lactis subsp. cremoris TaxID=1359 RepID=A0AAX4AKQ4_LACLC|nr:nuclear transport factor 2 family protein [Lactococcus cremoris]WMX71692.1 nuclear transport factor 2 family protein [Lactococcus cremoris]